VGNFFKKIIGGILSVSILLSMSMSTSAQASTDDKKAEPMKKVLMVIAQKDFEDVELFEPKTILEVNGAKVTVASVTTDSAIGIKGRTIKPDLKISEAKAKDYDAVVVVGGTGAIATLWENTDLRALVQDANSLNKIVAAICGAPPVLAKAGLLDGKNATMFPWDAGIKELTKYGAKYVNEEVVVSDNIVTGKNPDASKAFGLKLCDVLGIRSFRKNVLMVIAPKDYSDIELFSPKTLLEINGAKITLASTTTEIAKGCDGSSIKPDIKISDAKAGNYDAIVVVGGTGVIGTLWEDKSLRSLLQDANKQKKIIAAICAAPPALSKAGLLKGKEATMFPWDGGIKELTKHGAKYVNKEVVVTGNIITGRNPDASNAFGLKICEVLGILGR
jgi:PfpI family intracellular protease